MLKLILNNFATSEHSYILYNTTPAEKEVRRIMNALECRTLTATCMHAWLNDG